MNVLEGDFPHYVLKCDGVDFEVLWHYDSDTWVMIEDYPEQASDLRAHIGVTWDDWQDGISEAVASYERQMEIKEKQQMIEVVK